VSANKIQYDVIRAFGSTGQNADFPVWCPDNVQVDTSLFLYSLPPAADQTVTLVIDQTHPVKLPILDIYDPTTNYDFICEDL